MLEPAEAVLCGWGTLCRWSSSCVFRLHTHLSTPPNHFLLCWTLQISVLICQLDPRKVLLVEDPEGDRKDGGGIGGRDTPLTVHAGHTSYCPRSIPVSFAPTRHFGSRPRLLSAISEAASVSHLSQRSQCQLGTTPSSEAELQVPCVCPLSSRGPSCGRHFLGGPSARGSSAELRGSELQNSLSIYPLVL